MGSPQEDVSALPELRVTLIREAAENLDRTEERTGLSRTDIVNRAITLYEFIDSQLAAGQQLQLRARDGAITIVRFGRP